METNKRKTENRQVSNLCEKIWVFSRPERNRYSFGKRDSVYLHKFSGQKRSVRVEVGYKIFPRMIHAPKIVLKRNDKSFIGNKHSLEPGKYNLNISVPGYKNIVKNIEIHPGRSTVVLTNMLEAAPREVVFRLKGENGKDIRADKIFVNGKEIKSGSKLQPGKYNLRICKKEYKEIRKTINLEVGTRRFEFSERLKPILFPVLKTTLTLRFTDSLSSEPLQPLVYIDKMKYKKGMKLAPGKYKLETLLEGYENFSAELNVGKTKNLEKSFRLQGAPREVVFLLKKQLWKNNTSR